MSANGFKIGTKHGRISGRIPLSLLDASTATVLAVDDVPDGDISLWEAARRESGGTGPGAATSTSGARVKKKLCRGRCRCVGADVLCNSLCHGSTNCNNK